MLELGQMIRGLEESKVKTLLRKKLGLRWSLAELGVVYCRNWQNDKTTWMLIDWIERCAMDAHTKCPIRDTH
jgi:hypothetical protein